MLKKISTLSLILTLSACSVSSLETTHTSVSSIPKIQKNSLTQIRQCVIDELGPYMNDDYKQGYVFMVNSVSDGTVPNGGDGPLADSGRLQMINSLQRLFPDNFRQVLILAKNPAIFEEPYSTRQELGYLNELGYPEQSKLRLLSEALLYNFKEFRHLVNEQNKGIDKIRFLYIESAFSRNDSDDFYSRGGAISGEYNNTKTTTELNLGANKSKKVLSLTLNVVDPELNFIIDGANFDLEFVKDKKDQTLTISHNGIGTGVTFEKQTIESLHSAQQTLIDYASIWVIKKYSSKDLSKCITF